MALDVNVGNLDLNQEAAKLVALERGGAGQLTIGVMKKMMTYWTHTYWQVFFFDFF